MWYLETLRNKNDYLKDFYVCNITLTLGTLHYAHNVKEHR